MLRCPECGGDKFFQWQTVSERIKVTEEGGEVEYGEADFYSVDDRGDFLCGACKREFSDLQEIIAYVIEGPSGMFYDGERWNQRQFATKYNKAGLPMSLSGDDRCLEESYYRNSEDDCGWGDENGQIFAVIRRA